MDAPRYVLAGLQDHFREHRQMVFLSGPRQVGKTTVARHLADAFEDTLYLNWDDPADRARIVAGSGAIAGQLALDRLRDRAPFIAFDELHKYQHWRTFLKGYFDTWEGRVNTLVTGSAALSTFRRGGDSLMGRYFPYTLHPMSVAECVGAKGDPLFDQEPVAIDDGRWDALLRFGGFPEPFLKSNQRFYNRWRGLRTEQLFREEIRDLTRIQELGQLQLIAGLIREQVGQLTSYTYLAKTARVAVDTVRRWLRTLEAFYYCFRVRPWHQNVSRALRKEPKYFLWDWSQIEEPGARAENLVASALLKATDWWTESGYGTFEVRFIRNKEQREVDFVVVRDRKPWILVEVKLSARAPLTDSLAFFQAQTGAEFAFQVAIDAPYVARNCFEHRQPIIVPARTLLAQLV